jgi:hypothetical protein
VRRGDLLLDELALRVTEKLVVEVLLVDPLRGLAQARRGWMDDTHAGSDHPPCASGAHALAKLTHLLLGRGLVLGQAVDVVAKGGNLVVDVAVAARLVGASGGVGLCARSRQ